MKTSAHIAAIAGLGLAVGIIAYNGFATVAGVLLEAGWGLAIVTLFHLLPLLLLAGAWRAVLPDECNVPAMLIFWARLVRESINNLLPVAQIGGPLIGARALTLHGVPASVAGASTIVDVTAEVATQFIFTIVGLALLVVEARHAPALGTIGIGIGVMALAFGGFILAQRWGMLRALETLLARAAERWSLDALGALANLHDNTLALYRRRKQLLLGGLLHLACWVVGAGEVWLALHFLGHDVSLGTAVALEALSQAVRSAAFLVPGALGVQEGGFILLGGLFGLSPATCLALSLAKRVRELAIGVPTLGLMQVLEGRRLWQNRKRARLAGQDGAE